MKPGSFFMHTKIYFIYGIFIGDMPVYIGRSKSPITRFKSHISSARQPAPYYNLHRFIKNKLYEGIIPHIKILKCTHKDDVGYWEGYFVKMYQESKTLFNWHYTGNENPNYRGYLMKIHKVKKFPKASNEFFIALKHYKIQG